MYNNKKRVPARKLGEALNEIISPLGGIGSIGLQGNGNFEDLKNCHEY